jgi:hypothetical protein
MNKLSSTQALELLISGRQLRCTEGPLLGHNIEITIIPDYPDKTKKRLSIRIESRIVSLEQFLECKWIEACKCEQCHGTGWLAP